MALITARPYATLTEVQHARPTRAALSTLWRTIDRLGLTVKKTVHADEQRRPDVAAARRLARHAATARPEPPLRPSRTYGLMKNRS